MESEEFSQRFIETTPEQDMAELAIVHARHWQAVLSNPTRHDELISEQEIINELNGFYPYIGQAVFMSGVGMHPVQDEETGRLTDEIWEHRFAQGGIHHGFYIDDYAEADTMERQIMHQLTIGEISEKIGKTLFQKQVLVSLFNLDSMVLPVNDIDRAFGIEDQVPDYEFEKRLDLMMGYSKKLTKIYKSTSFRRMNHEQQISLVREFLSEADRKTKLRDISVMVTAEYAYVPLLTSGWQLIQFPVEELDISGTCIGLESTESVTMKEKAIRKDSDLIDKKAGLCLVIDPDDETREELRLRPDSILYLPTYSQPFEICDVA